MITLAIRVRSCWRLRRARLGLCLNGVRPGERRVQASRPVHATESQMLCERLGEAIVERCELDELRGQL